MDHFFTVLAWSFNCLFSGLRPTHDYRGIRFPPNSKEAKKAGKSLAAGYYAVVVGLSGDADCFAKFLRMPHGASNTRPRCWCEATKAGPFTWRDSRKNAPWRGTVFSPSTWEVMHVKYLGHQQFFLGSALWLLCFEQMPGSPIQNLRQVGLTVQRYQNTHHVSAKFPSIAFQKLTCFLKAKGFPKTKGKGSHIRHVVPAIAYVWKKNMNRNDANHKLH